MKVLIAVDGSEPSVRACRVVAGMIAPGSATVRLLTVLSYDAYPYSLVPGEGPPPDEAEKLAADRERVEQATAAPRRALEGAGHRVEVTNRFGNVRTEILAEVEAWSPDVLVLGRRGVHGLERWLGSVSEHVVRHVGVPILLVP